MISFGGVGGTVNSESALRSAAIPLSQVRAPPPAPWPDGGPESLRSPCCGLDIYTSDGLIRAYSIILNSLLQQHSTSPVCSNIVFRRKLAEKEEEVTIK
ncbi:hypothetical protein PoB_000714300 [Plakobranchus ocellatus]|uniref:Uncharacterized protein n=1 Tax=Plakobranchus ocellatus TaxID=259542 RepID=A0AAV3YDW6_9GAST|nr:hypothetical protein PoB_000714300 [Plakobranchus ocellatus]